MIAECDFFVYGHIYPTTNHQWTPYRELLELCATTEQFANPSDISRIRSDANGKLLDGLSLMWVGGNDT